MFGSTTLDIAEVAAEDRSGWSAAARSARLVELLELREQVEAEVLRCVGEWDADLAWTADGSKSPAAWISRHTSMEMVDAREMVRTARFVQANEKTAKALAHGDVSSAHTAILARKTRTVDELYPEVEDVLLDAARSHKPDDFRDLVTRWRSMADDHLDREPASDRFDRRHLHVSDLLDGMTRVDGYLDGETGERLRKVLDVLEPPDPVDGPEVPRSLGQRRADALTRLVGGESTPRVTVHAVVDVETLASRMPGDLTAMRCDLVGAGPVDVATILRLTCDCSIARVLMRGRSEVLDLGRSTPVVSDALRRALAVRDGGCTEPGCDAPPEWCDAHHETHWSQGGPTALWNLKLKCRRHHVAAHRRRGPPMDLAA
jgi:hypothetical protein